MLQRKIIKIRKMYNIAFEEEFELISSIDDNIKPEVCFGIDQYAIKKEENKYFEQ